MAIATINAPPHSAVVAPGQDWSGEENASGVTRTIDWMTPKTNPMKPTAHSAAITRRGPGINSAARPANTNPTPNKIDDEPGPPGRNRTTSSALRCTSVGPMSPGSNHSRAGSRSSRMAHGMSRANDSSDTVNNFSLAGRSRTTVAVAVAAMTHQTNHNVGTKENTTARSNVEPKTRRQVTGRTRPTRGAQAIATHGMRTMTTAEPIRPPETAPVTAGRVAYAIAAHTRAHQVCRSGRDARYILIPAIGMSSSKITSTATEAEPRMTPDKSVSGSSHVGASADEPVPTSCHGAVNIVHRSPAPGGAGSSAPPRRTPVPNSARSPMTATARRMSPTRVPG